MSFSFFSGAVETKSHCSSPALVPAQILNLLIHWLFLDPEAHLLWHISVEFAVIKLSKPE
jgi:hypothetical protein